MRQLWPDIVSHRRTVLFFLAFWAALLVLTAVTWSGGMPAWVFFPHLLLLPLCAGLATSDFQLSSRVVGLAVSLIDLFFVGILPMAFYSLSHQPLPEEPMFTGWAAVFEVLEFAILVGIPGFIMGHLGGVMGRRFWPTQQG